MWSRFSYLLSSSRRRLMQTCQSLYYTLSPSTAATPKQRLLKYVGITFLLVVIAWIAISSSSSLRSNKFYKLNPLVPTTFSFSATPADYEGSIVKYANAPQYYVVQNGQRHYLPTCFICGEFVNICNILTLHSNLPDQFIDRIPVGDNFLCGREMPERIANYYATYRFEKPTLIQNQEGAQHYGYGRKITRLTTCMDCGHKFGNLCEGRFPQLRMTNYELGLIGDWAKLPNGKPEPFQCHKDLAEENVLKPLEHRTWGIMTPPHTLFLANMIADALRAHSWDVEIFADAPGFSPVPTEFKRDVYVVISAFIFPHLPPPSKRICVQLEQKSSSWFTEHYISVLRESYSVLEYNFFNIPFLTDLQISANVWYVPMGSNPKLLPPPTKRSQKLLNMMTGPGTPPTPMPPTPIVVSPPQPPMPQIPALGAIGKNILLTHPQHSPMAHPETIASGKEWDIIFYGDLRAARRTNMLNELSQMCKVKIVTETFGMEVLEMIKKARFVINIHYYIPAQLEVYRIYEALSLGTAVISETAYDQHLYPELNSVVKYFDADSISSMLTVVKQALNEPDDTSRIASVVKLSHARFRSMFNRFLLGISLMPLIFDMDELYHGRAMNFPKSIDQPVILSLPETPSRRISFQTSTTVPTGPFFDGIRLWLYPSWISTGLSYSTIARLALKQGIKQLTIAEDDVVLPPHYTCMMHIIKSYLDSLGGKWDLFSGLIADLHADTKILDVVVFQDMQFITIDKMVSAVFNIYNTRTLTLLSQWDPTNENVIENTIDRYLENQGGLRVIITLPFFVSHNDQQYSTLWNFKNDQYNGMIQGSQNKLLRKVQEYQLSRNKQFCDSQGPALLSEEQKFTQEHMADVLNQAGGQKKKDQFNFIQL